MAAAAAPSLDDRRTKATFDLFKELKCVWGGGEGDDNDEDEGEGEDEDEDEFEIDDVGRLDVEKMMARVLDGLAAVCEAQRVRVALKKPLKLQKDGDALTSEQQAARNRVFLAALNTVAKGLTYDGAPERADPGFSTELLLRAFPDSSKVSDGRGWLPLHWAVVADVDGEVGVPEADVMTVYKTDPMALRQHHLYEIANDEEKKRKFGYTPAQLLCGMEMTEKNMSLVRYLSESDPRAFTMQAITRHHRASFSALHVACMNPHSTEALLRLLVQLDASQMKSMYTPCGGPLGLFCEYQRNLDSPQFSCLVEADSSVEVVHDAIRNCCQVRTTFPNRVRAVAKLLEVNPAAAQHKNDRGRILAHHACVYSDTMTGEECVEILKLVLARHKDALKMVDEYGELPAHIAAELGPVGVLDFVLGEYPEAAAMFDSGSNNLLHLAVENGPVEHRMAKARLLCARCPDMMLQRDRNGYTPLTLSCDEGPDAMSLLLLEAGGRDVAFAAIQHQSNAEYLFNGWLPLHYLIHVNAATLREAHLSSKADAFRLLLRLYPEAAGTEVGVFPKKTPYQLAVIKGLPAYYRRLLLCAAPDLDPAGLRRLNWDERRLAMFVAFAAVSKSRLLLARLRVINKDLVKHVVSFL